MKNSSRRKAQKKYQLKMPVVGVRLSHTLNERIKDIAEKEGKSESEWIREQLNNIVNYKKNRFKGTIKKIFDIFAHR